MTTELTIPGDLIGLRRVQDFIEQALITAALPEHTAFATKLAAEEALVAAIKHDNQMDPEKAVHVTCTISAEGIDIRITAEGEGAEPRSVTGRRL